MTYLLDSLVRSESYLEKRVEWINARGVRIGFDAVAGLILEISSSGYYVPIDSSFPDVDDFLVLYSVKFSAWLRYNWDSVADLPYDDGLMVRATRISVWEKNLGLACLVVADQPAGVDPG
jgi:hypothetical protein